MLGLGSYESSSDDESTNNTSVGVKRTTATVDRTNSCDSLIDAQPPFKKSGEDTANEVEGKPTSISWFG